jgi:signal transduction histidine kinase
MIPIRRLLLRDLLTLVGLTVLTLSLLFWWGARRALNHQAELRARDGLVRLKEEVHTRVRSVQETADRVQLHWNSGHLNPFDPQECQRRLDDLLERGGAVSSLILFLEDGTGIYCFWQDPDASHRASWWTYAFRRSSNGLEFRAISQGGRSIWQESLWKPANMNPQERPWYQRALRGEGAGWVEPYLFAAPRVAGLTYSIPLRDANGRFRGALAVDMLLDSMTEHARRAQLTVGSQVLASDPQNRVLMFFGPQVATAKKPKLLDDANASALPLFQPLLDAPHQKGILGDSRFTFDGRRYLGVKEALEDPPGLHWTLSLVVPESELEAPVTRLALGMGAIALLGLSLVAWRSIQLARRFAQPLTHLSESAEALGRGEAMTLPESPLKEIHTLGQALKNAECVLKEQSELKVRLAQSERMETVGTLAGGIAHDVNNQLGAVLGQLELVMMTMLEDDPSRPRIARAIEAVHRCARTANALLAFSHQARPELTPLDLGSFVKMSAATIQQALGDGIRVSTDTPAEAVMIAGEAAQLRQLLWNLAQNAQDAMPDGGDLRLSVRRATAQECLLEILDTGKGMDASTKAKIFEPFFTTKAVGEGTGLGLTVVHGIAKMHHARIEIESQPNKGTSLRLFFQSLSQQDGAGITDSGAHVIASLKGIRALIVEDEIALREVMRRALEHTGAHPKEAVDGEAAWRLWESESFDFILSDQRMPSCTGLELLARIRARDRKVPFLLISGQDLADIQDQCSRDAQLRFLPKPFRVSELLGKIDEMLKPK